MGGRGAVISPTRGQGTGVELMAAPWCVVLRMARCVQMGVWKWSEAEGSNGLCGNVRDSSSSRCLTRGGSGVGLSRWASTSTSYSLGQEASGWLLPLAARTLATAPWILGIVLWALPLEMAQLGAGVCSWLLGV